MKTRTSRLVSLALAPAILSASGNHAWAQVCIPYVGEIYKQDFNSMSATGTSSTMPTGWGYAETGPGANNTYAASSGTDTAGNTYSFGSAGSPDRALGEISAATFQSMLGNCVENLTGAPITSFQVGYTGEQWRSGAAGGVADQLFFEYSTTVTSLTDPVGWLFAPELDFTSPNNGPAGPLDGNLAANRVVFAPVTITLAAPIANSALLFMRWRPSAIAGANDGLAIDDFTLRLPGTKCSLDVDGNGAVDALTDGLMILRAMFGLTGNAVTNNAVTPNAPRADWGAQIRPYLNDNCGTNFGQ